MAKADDPDDLLQPLEAALRQSLADERAAAAKHSANQTLDNDETDASVSTLRQRELESDGLLGQLREAIASEDAQRIDEALRRISTFGRSETVRNAGRQLREELRRRDETSQQEIARQTQPVWEQIGKDIKTAAKPSDLDPALEDLSKLRRKVTALRLPKSSQTPDEKFEQAQRFLMAWQDYLSEQRSGNTGAAIQLLQSTASYSPPDFIKRSEVLERIEELKAEQKTDGPLERILARLKTLDDLTTVLPALRTLFSTNTYLVNTDTLQKVLGELERYGRIYNEYRAGLMVRIEEYQLSPYQISAAMPPAVTNIEAQLMRLIYARELDVEDRLKPGSDEPISTYFQRVMTDARERCDARLMLRLQQLTGYVYAKKFLRNSPNNSDVMNDSSVKALQALLAAQNQDEAGQFVPAVISYQTALKLGGEYVMPKAIGQRLDTIKAAHLKEFDQALQMALDSKP